MHMPAWLRGLPEEVWFFLRIAAYAFFIGTVYWILTYEAAGTMLLYGFGLAAGFSMLVLGLAARHIRGPDQDAPEGDDVAGRGAAALEANGPFGDEGGRIPSPSIAPFAVGFGAAVLALGLVLGPWLIGLGLLVAILGAIQWLAAAQRELSAVERTGSTPVAPAPRFAPQPQAGSATTSEARASDRS